MNLPIYRYNQKKTETEPKPSRWGFEYAQAEHSFWVETHKERGDLVSAFGNWKRRTGSLLSLKTERVGADDPDGEGYRCWFYHKPEEFYAAWPKVRKYDLLKLEHRARLYTVGITDEQKYIASAYSTTNPSTVPEWERLLNDTLLTGKSQFQQYLKEIGAW